MADNNSSQKNAQDVQKKNMDNILEAVESLGLKDDGVDQEKKKRVGVRFRQLEAEIVGTIPTREDLSDQEKKETWWTATEYQGIRLGCKFLTKDIRRREKSIISCIEEAYARALHLACTLSDDEYETLMIDCLSQAICMKPWCDRQLSPRGLERYTSHKHRFERTEFAEETRAAVLRLAGNGTISAEQLSVFYKEYARSAAIYARFCGEIDFQVSERGKNSTSGAAMRNPRSPTKHSTLNGVTSSLDRSFSSVSRQPSTGKLMVRQLSTKIESTQLSPPKPESAKKVGLSKLSPPNT